jgi:serine protease
MKKFFIFCLFILGVGFALSTFTGLANQGDFDSIVLDFRENVPAAQIQQEIRAIAKQYKVNPHFNSEFSAADHVYIIKGDKQLLAALRKSPLAKDTEFIEPNYIYSALEVPNDPYYVKQWNLRNINVETAWQTTKGQGVTVAVIDTGVSRVPDLKATEFVPGYDFVNDRVAADDDHGHGTHVAGTVAQSTNNGLGVAGIAYQAKIMPLKVLSASGGGTVSDIAEAIKFAADKGADVINMSLGGSGSSNLMEEAINYAHQKGTVVIAAAGNSNRNAAGYPARYPRVIGVAALDATGGKAPYSNYGAGVDISAPGGSTAGGNADGGILQNTINPATGESVFASFQGTSMASPHVAGVAALIKASGVKEPDKVLQLLKESARVVKEDPLNYYGAGQLDAAVAVQKAVSGQFGAIGDFFRWLRDNGYLDARFWFDGGAIALLPKIAMVVGSYLLALFLRKYFPVGWVAALSGGLIVGSSGLFFLQGLYIFDLPQWPFRLMGSSLPELGNVIQGSTALNPIFASVLIPFGLIALLLGHRQWKWFAIGSTLGVASCLTVSAFTSTELMWLGSGAIAQAFLIINALLCFGLAYLSSKTEDRFA